MSQTLKSPSEASRTPGYGAILAILVLVPISVWGLAGLRLENNIEDWLATDDPQAQTLDWFRSHFPDENRILVSWDGSRLDDPRLESFVKRLREINRRQIERHGAPVIAEVITPHDLIRQMEAGKVDEQQARERLEGVLLEPHDPAEGGAVGLLVRCPPALRDDPSTCVAAIFAAARSAGIEPADVHLGGTSVTTAALNDEVVKAVWDPQANPLNRSVFGLSALMGALLTLGLLRSVRLGLVVLVVGYAAGLISTAVLGFSGKSMNMVLVVMPTLLLVLSLSAAIHVANYWRHAADANPQTAVADAVRQAFVPCLLASLTTAIGLLSLSISSLEPIRDFGVFSSIGLMISLACVLLVLPGLLLLCAPLARKGLQVDHPYWNRFGREIVRRRWLIAAAGLVAFVAGTCGLYWFHTDTKVARYFPRDSRLSRDYRFLERHVAGLDSLEIVIRFDRALQEDVRFFDRVELVRAVQTAVQKHPRITGAISLADFQPVRTPPPESAGFLQKGRYNKRSQTTEVRLKSEHSDEIAPFLQEAQTAGHKRGRDGRRLHEAGDELWRVTAQTYVLADTDYGRLMADLDALARAALDGRDGASHAITGTVALFKRTQEIVLESLLRSLLIAFAVIALVMSLLLRDFIAGLWAMLPNVVPIGLVFGLMSWFGQVIDIGTILTGAVALGIAVDGTLHLLTWFRAAIDGGAMREDAAVYALHACGPAMWHTSAVVSLSLLMLFPSDLLLISRFGWVMAALLGTALLSNLLALPILLSGPLGRRIAARAQRAAERASGASGSGTDLQKVAG